MSDNNKLYRVASGIMDAKEYLDINLKDTYSVHAYAESLDVILDEDEAEKIISVTKKFLELEKNGEINGSNDYYYEFKAKLLSGE